MSQIPIHFDNAATSWPKPPEVIDAIAGYYRDWGRAAGRGGYASAMRAESIVNRCREKILRLTGAGQAGSAVFAHNGTDALNLAIHGILHPGDHVVTTALEHNSVLRPLYAARDSIGVKLDIVWPDPNGRIDPEKLADRVRPDTRLVCINQASNVTGLVQDVAAICHLSRRRGARHILIDASQTLGRYPFNFAGADWDLLASAGHKGLFGPLGTGLLVIRDRAAVKIRPLRQGGTGSDSELETQPVRLPQRLECGNLNVGGIAGLSAGLDFVSTSGVEIIHRHEMELHQKLVRQLESLDGIRLWGNSDSDRVAICSLTFDGKDVHEVAAILDSSFGMEVRAGLHCAPLALKESDRHPPVATLRISPGWYNTAKQIYSLVAAIEAITGAE